MSINQAGEEIITIIQKLKKFLVVHGKAKLRFQNILNKKNSFQVSVSSKELKVIETVPGYTHIIKNVGKDELITIWFNQIFDKKPDTIFKEVN